MFKATIRNIFPLLHALIPDRIVRYYFGEFIPIFMMHRFSHPDHNISGIDTKSLRTFLEYFKKNRYTAISLMDLIRLLQEGEDIPDRSAVFTIDDGFIDQYEIAAPLFEEYDIPLTYFVVTDMLNGDNWPWDDQLTYLLNHAAAGTYSIDTHGETVSIDIDDDASRKSAILLLRKVLKSERNSDIYNTVDMIYNTMSIELPSQPPKEYTPMTWQDAKTLTSRGHHVAAHSCTHRILSRLTDTESQSEIIKSVRAISDNIPDSPPIFAYPTGRRSDFTPREIETLKGVGIQACVSSVPETFNIRQERFDIDRYSIPRLTLPRSKNEFIQYLSWIEFIKQKALPKRDHKASGR